MSKKSTDALRESYVKFISDSLAAADEEVLRVGTGEVAIPVVDSEGNEQYVVFVVKIPSGSRDGDPYDAYAMAEEYEMKQADKKEKAEKAAAEKERKIAADKKAREARAAARAKHKAEN